MALGGRRWEKEEDDDESDEGVQFLKPGVIECRIVNSPTLTPPGSRCSGIAGDGTWRDCPRVKRKASRITHVKTVAESHHRDGDYSGCKGV